MSHGDSRVVDRQGNTDTPAMVAAEYPETVILEDKCSTDVLSLGKSCFREMDRSSEIHTVSLGFPCCLWRWGEQTDYIKCTYICQLLLETQCENLAATGR